ncbi:MAG: hypothetical protein NC397_00065 [Clostridium sp.]|nr:hypothetical protein [Clostridium sp.]
MFKKHFGMTPSNYR